MDKIVWLFLKQGLKHAAHGPHVARIPLKNYKLWGFL